MNDDTALGYVLGTLDEDEHARAERAMRDDAEFAAAIERARADVDDIQRGITLVAADAPRTHSARRGSTWSYRMLGAAATVALVTVGVLSLSDTAPPPAEDAAGSEMTDSAMMVEGYGSLDVLSAESVAIVVGTIVDVTKGTVSNQEDAMTYELATVAIEETIKGAATTKVYALDYTSGWAVKGQRVLLFLASSEGTIHEDIAPKHDQVMHGDAGSYEIRDGELVGAPFTLDEVRQKAQ